MLNIQLKKVVGKKIEKYIDDISFIRRAVFRDWPYLYEGSEEYEIDYLKHYAKNDRSICVLAYVDGVLAGITTAMPLVDEHEQMKAPVVKAGYNIEKIFYLAESCLLSKYRGHGIYRQFFKAREDHAQSFGEDYDSVCFCGVLRPEDHPFKPQEYYP
ncbi:MAG: hypothetical protein KDD50_11325, partial [Bdellovibrionales bacterium]|nr:hypothetical protein [Bdellovibrionales bacterium]